MIAIPHILWNGSNWHDHNSDDAYVWDQGENVSFSEILRTHGMITIPYNLWT